MKGTNEWPKFARDDFEALLLIEQSDLYRPLCFHAHQLAEKILKAAIFEQGSSVPRIHDLVALYQKANVASSVEPADLQFLSSVYIETRYPSEVGLLPHGQPSRDDANRAIRIARTIYGTVLAGFTGHKE